MDERINFGIGVFIMQLYGVCCLCENKVRRKSLDHSLWQWIVFCAYY